MREETDMGIELLPARPEHVPELARIGYEAFKDVAERHGFPLDWSNLNVANTVIDLLVRRQDVYGVAAVLDGQLAGSNFVMTSDEVAGVGPITVDVTCQGHGIGRKLMERVIDHALCGKTDRVRLLQDSFNMASLSLYASLGFDTKEACALMQPIPAASEDPTIRPVTEADLPAIENLSTRIYKVSRRNEVAAFLKGPFVPLLRDRDGRIVGYFLLGFMGHGVAETEEDALALVGQAAKRTPPEGARFFCPLSEGSLYRQFLKMGCRAIKVRNLMAMGPYDPPEGVWMPSIDF